MRLLALLTDAYGGYGGISVYNRDVLNALCENPNIDEVVAFARHMPGTPEPIPAKLQYNSKGISGLRSFISQVVRGLLQKGSYSAVFCGHINLIPLAWICAKRYRCPLILQIHGIDAWQPTGRKLTDYLVGKVDIVCSVSGYTRDKFLSWARVEPDRVNLMHNAVNLSAFGVAPKSTELVERYSLSNKRVLMTFGRLVSKQRAKGFDEVLDLMPELLQTDPDLVYMIAGDGDYRSDLEQKVSQLGLENSVRFTGMVAEHEKADIYRLADLYVMPSRGEGFGFVFLEAMACGVPVIASAVDGSSDAVRGGKLGPLVHPDDKQSLKSEIFRGLKKPKQIPEGLDYFSFSNFKSRWNTLVSQALTF